MKPILIIKIKGKMQGTNKYAEQEIKIAFNHDYDEVAQRNILAPWVGNDWNSPWFQFFGDGYSEEFKNHPNSIRAFELDHFNNGQVYIDIYGKWVR